MLFDLLVKNDVGEVKNLQLLSFFYFITFPQKEMRMLSPKEQLDEKVLQIFDVLEELYNAQEILEQVSPCLIWVEVLIYVWASFLL